MIRPLARFTWLATALGLTTAVGATGCNTEAFCFTDCASGSSSGTGSMGSGTGGEGGCLFNCSSSSGTGGGEMGGGGGHGGSGACMPTNGGIEICDGKDNDCNGKVDDVPGLDLNAIQTCGTCDHNCLTELTNNDPASIKCMAGKCSGMCAKDYYDLDHNGSCEYYCQGGTSPENVCNGIDDDCNGKIDEGVDFCTSTTDCGGCGNNCVVLHGTPACEHTGATPCTMSNTHCAVAHCDCPDAQGNCWWDLDGRVETGCEYQCQITNNGVEICDGLDNDCDGLIDAADNLNGDTRVGVACFGSQNGECATPAHQGMTVCQGGQVLCTGPNVLTEHQHPETCNGLDDDCDGVVDNNPTDAGGSCGVSNIFPCSFGTYQCQNGMLVCTGAVNPGVETCNGIDDDCDGTPDSHNGMPPSDSVGPCNVTPPPPPGVTQPCRAGTKACVSGTVVCQGSILPQTTTDTCGVDANCDGQLTNQPDLQNDVAHCGSCTNNCYAGAVHSNWACVSGTCQFQGCAPGYYDLDGDHKCEYACVFIQATETCNGVDDNCNGQIDEGVVAPSPTQVCGVSTSATTPECTTGVSVACQSGTWHCTFPAGVCNAPGGCHATPEICDTLDNNCNGLLNENTPNYGKPCNSDDGRPPPGDGACRRTGTYVCSGPNATVCNAVKADCATLPGGCTELCDGIDNDCDGLVDEPFSNKGSNAANFVKPVVTHVAASTWIYTYEASRPSATNITPGSGDGYWTSAPTGTTIDKTPACSAPGKIPWFNVTPQEVEQTCTAMGGTVCAVADWQSACQTSTNCSWGYNPRTTAACTTSYTSTKYCNLGMSFDFNPMAAGDQDGLLVTGSTALQNCWSDWSGVLNNVATNNKLFDMTGNLREITKKTGVNQYALMGGAFNSQSEAGSACGFSFYTVNDSFKYYDTGFRCCFSADPTM